MKQLKFMLAAATAISLAAAAQATTQLEKTEISSENFDDPGIALTNSAAVLALNGFTYEGATASDNESYVVAGGANSTANALKVNTGTDPLLRKIYPAGAATGVPLDATKKVYIDTMVQFTVTPYGDTVSSNGVNDKLMIYLKEMTNVVDGVVTITGTKLMVKASQYRAADYATTFVPTFTATDVEISNVEVVPETWYKLEVVSYLENGITLFNIKLGGTELVSATPLYTDAAKKVFPSLLGNSSATLNYVGFAGEGMVDDLVFSQDVEQQTSVDFTFTLAWDEAGFSSVTYTIDGGESVTPENGGSFTVPDTKKLVIAYTLNDWYKISGTPVLEYTAAVNETDSLTLEAVKTAAVVDGKIEVTESTKPADVGIETGSFAADTTPVAELNKALTWATTKGGATSASAAGTLVSGLNFTDGEEETDAEKAYLLDCTEDQLSGENGEIAKFKFAGFDPATGAFEVGTEKKVGDKAAYGNGYVEVRGSATVGGAYDEAADKSKHSFFKAFLVPFQPAAVDAE